MNPNVTLKLLGTAAVPISGRIRESTGSRVRVSVPTRVALGLPAEIDGENVLMLGEVVGSESLEGGFAITIEVAHSLGALRELDRLNRALIGSDHPAGTPGARAQGSDGSSVPRP